MPSVVRIHHHPQTMQGAYRISDTLLLRIGRLPRKGEPTIENINATKKPKLHETNTFVSCRGGVVLQRPRLRTAQGAACCQEAAASGNRACRKQRGRHGGLMGGGRDEVCRLQAACPRHLHSLFVDIADDARQVFRQALAHA